MPCCAGVKDREISAEQAIKRLERSRHWVWTAIDPESKLLLAIKVGPRTLEMAQRVVHQVAQRLAPNVCPLALAMASRAICPPLWVILAAGFTQSAAKPQARGPSHAGCRCLSCSMHR